MGCNFDFILINFNIGQILSSDIFLEFWKKFFANFICIIVTVGSHPYILVKHTVYDRDEVIEAEVA